MYIEDFINYIKSEKRYSDYTVISYVTDLNQFFRFLHKEYQISDPKIIKFKMIRNWITSMLDSNLKPSSRKLCN